MADKNINRRHLSHMQRVEVAEKFVEYEQKRAAERQKALAGTRPHETQTLETQLPKVETGKALDLAAKKVGISGETLRRAKRVKERGTPELIEAMKKETIGIKTADSISALPREQQNEVLRAKIEKPVIKPEPGECFGGAGFLHWWGIPTIRLTESNFGFSNLRRHCP